MLILAATPIGNLGDTSARLRSALENAVIIAAEDTRTTVRLLAGLGIDGRPRLIALHEHNERERAAEIVALAADGDVLLLSDAGMPTVSDPGYPVVTAAIAAGIPVTVIPGPSAVLAALALSGLPTDRFVFEGFLPRKAGQRLRRIRDLATEERTVVLFESPARLYATLAQLADVLGGARLAAVCRELTKLHEEVVRGTLVELAEWSSGGVRGEICLVIAGATPRAVEPTDMVPDVLTLVTAGVSVKDAVAEVAERSDVSRRALYQAVLVARKAPS